MRSVVIYSSQTGHTAKYARWIADELGADKFEASDITRKRLRGYDLVIYGGWLHAGKVKGLGLIKRNLSMLREKRVAVFATGAMPGRPEEIDEVLKRNFSPDERKFIRFFYLRGGFDFSKLNPRIRLVMRVLKFILEKKKNPTQDEINMINAFRNPVDFTRKADIAPIISFATHAGKHGTSVDHEIE